MYEWMRDSRLSLMLATVLRRLHLSSRSGLSPGSSTFQQPGEVLIHDERDTRAREHPNEVRSQAAVESYEALVRPSVRDRGRDRAMVRAREHRVVLVELVSCVQAPARKTMGRAGGGVEGLRGGSSPGCASGPLGTGMLRKAQRASTRPT